MPRAVTNRNKPSVITQTLEIPTTQVTEEKEKPERPDFWTYMQSLTPEEWKEHIVYLTRERPKTHMNGVVGGYLAKIVEPFDQDDIKTAYGGYEFSYIMKRGRDAVYSGRFTVEAEPRLDKGREVTTANGDGTPAGFANQFISVLREELERSRASGSDPANTKTIEMLSKASDKAMDMIKQQVPETSSPSSTLKDLVTVAKDLGIFPAAGGGDSSIIKTIEALQKLGLIGQPTAVADPMKQLETMLSIFTKIDEIRGSGGSRRGNWKDSLVDKGLELVPQVLDTFRETREANLRIASDRVRAAEHLRAVQNPSAIPPRPSVMTPRGGTATPEPVVTVNSGLRTVPLDRAGEPGATAPTEVSAPAEITFETIDRNSTAYVNLVKQTIVEMINRGSHGEQIVDYLDGAQPGFSNTLIAYQPDQLTAYFALDPILRTVAQHPNWPEVLDEARKYILEAENAEEEGIPAPADGKHRPN